MPAEAKQAGWRPPNRVKITAGERPGDMGLETPETERIVVPEPEPLRLPQPEPTPDTTPVPA
jgi:hypothetical protein